ncbi:glucose/arabinose dehydrogenase [Dokdonella fugitiva]|uniref:Glucose/arabinose dehydrogenase n=1 Tax=Dokdonella fugitiva TaxID=328517 RepID=A0A839F6M8_9GAMM|nr:PQQ-dependent sugar dehydrogenase [Dokdonella fugitiva]MBA8889722.1 glucose/arabinose dehydrogenase [Dokdonella fugitiva]
MGASTAVSLAVAGALAAGAPPSTLPPSSSTGPNPTLPPPHKTLVPTVEVAETVGWKEGETPTAAAGFAVAEFARDLDHPRWLYVLPNGDVLVAESDAPPKPDDGKGIKGAIMKKLMKKAGSATPSANRISLLRDDDRDGKADRSFVFASGLNSPIGMALVGDAFYVANTDAVVRFAYTAGATRLDGSGERIVDLPAGTINHHWTKNIIATPDGTSLYVAIGSNSNVGENGIDAERGRAAVSRIDLATRTLQPFASGLRNPVGLAFQPDSGALWTAVNERDELGDDLVPDYITSVKEGAFYGWPYSWWGSHVDERMKPANPERAAAATDGKPSGAPEPVLTGFLNADGKAHGRPVGVAFDGHGGLLVADDVGGRVWRITPQGDRQSE